MTVHIEAPDEVTADLAAEVARLVRQLSTSAPPLTRDALAAIVASPGTTVLVARTGTDLTGMLTLVTFRIPTGVRAWIEDVVVDERARGTGVGAGLVREAVRRAQEAGARSVDLTSRPSRAAAHRLYVRAGFAPRDSTVYRLSLDPPEQQ